MDDLDGAVESHYTRGNLKTLVLDAIASAGKDPHALTIEDLAPLDEFHANGRAATADLARLARLSPGQTVLDVGAGLGGPSRHLAHDYGCHVTGLDLTREYCEVARMLADLTGLADRVAYRCGNALAMPFGDETFDVVWTQHATMNIADKAKLYDEMRRVLKVGGRLAFYDFVAGPGGEPYFPVPWSRSARTNHLVPPDTLRGLLEERAFRVVEWRDVSAAALTRYRRTAGREPAETRPPIGLHLLLGPDQPAMVRNLVRNLAEHRISLLLAVLSRTA